MSNRPSAAELLYQIDTQGVGGAASHYGVSKRTIAKWRSMYGLPAELACERIEPPPHHELRELYDAGCTIAELAQHYRVSPRTVRNWMSAKGIARRAPGFQKATNGLT